MLIPKVISSSALVFSMLAIAISANAAVMVNQRYMQRSSIGSTDRLISQSASDIMFSPGRFNSRVPKANQYCQRAIVRYLQQQDYSGAVSDLDEATKLDPNFALAYYLRSSLKYEKLNDRSGGITDMQRAARLFKQQNAPTLHLAATEYLKQWGGNN